MAGVALRSVTKTFGSVHALRDVTQAMKAGELTVVLGPSGCGKSTLLRVVAGLDDVTQGEVEIGGRRVTEVAPAKRGIAMVFQSYALYPHMTVFENMAFGLRLAKTDRGTITEKVQEAAKLLRIDHLLDRKPRALSGGQRQRVAMGRAIVRDPDVFLFDEPLSNLDAALRVEMRFEVARLQERFGATMVYVTHDQIEAMTLAHTIVVMRDGRIEQAGAPMDVYHAPRNRFVAGFIGSPGMNFLNATVAETGDGTVDLSLFDDRRLSVPVEPEEIRPGDEVALGIRPEDITLDGGDHAAIKGEVGMVERLGAETYLHIVLAEDQRLVVRVPGELRMRRGETVTLGLPPAACHVFRPDGSALPRRTVNPDRRRVSG